MATRSLGTLTLDLIARLGGFEQGMDRAARVASDKSREIERTSREASAKFESHWSGAAKAMVASLGAISAGAVFAQFVRNTVDAQNEQAQLAAVLRSTGEAAGFSAKQLNEMAAQMSRASTLSSGEINQAQTTLLAFTGIVGNQFPKALQAAVDMAARTGMSVVSAAETIGRALDIPSQGLTALSRQGFRFTEEQKALAQQLEATGRTAEAQAIILDALAESYGGAGAAARDTLGGDLAQLRKIMADLTTGSNEVSQSLRAIVQGLNGILESEATVAVVSGLVDGVSALAPAAAAFAAVGLAAYLGRTAASFAASRIEAIQHASATRSAAIASQQFAVAKVAEVQALVASAAGMQRLTVVQNALIPAQRALAASTEAVTASNRALSVSMLGLVGGPVGAMSLAIAAGVTAWSLWGRAGDEAVKKVLGHKGDLQSFREEFERLNAVQQEIAQRGLADQVEQATRNVVGAYERLMSGSSLSLGLFAPSAWREFSDGMKIVFDDLEMGEKQASEAVLRLAESLLKSAPTGEMHRGSMLNLANAYLEARKALAQYLEQQRLIAPAQEAATAGVQGTTEALIKTSEEARRYLDNLVDSSITAGLKTRREQLDALVEAGKLIFSPEDLKKARDAADTYDKGTASANRLTKGISDAARAAKQLNEWLSEQGISTASTEAMTAAYLKGGAAISELTRLQQIEEQVLKSGEKARAAVTAAVNAHGKAMDRLDAARQIDDLRRQNAAASAYLGVLQAQSVGLEEGRIALEAYNEQQALNELLVGKTTEEVADLTEQYRKLWAEGTGLGRQTDAMQELNRLVESTSTRQERYSAQLSRLVALRPYAQTEEQVRALDRAMRELERGNSIWFDLTEKALERIDESFADMWRNVIDGSQNAFDAMAGGFKQMLAEMAHAAITRPIMITVGNAIMGTSKAGGIEEVWGGGGLNLSNLLGGGNISSSVGQFAQNVGHSLWEAGFKDVGASLADNAYQIGQVANMAGNVIGYGKAIVDLTQGKYGSAVGTAIGTYILPGIGTAIGSMLGGMLDGAFAGETRYGGSFMLNDGQAVRTGGPSGGTGAGEAQFSQQLLLSATGALERAFSGANIDAAIANLTLAFESSDKGRGGTYSFGDLIIDGQTIRFGAEGKGLGHGGTSGSIEEMMAAAEVDMWQTVIQGWQAAIDEFPRVMQEMIRGVDADSLGLEAAQALAQQFVAVIEQVNALSMALDMLAFVPAAVATFDFAAALAEAAGGAENAANLLGSFYQNYYSEAERAAWLTEQLTAQFSDLGMTLPQTREEFRGLIEANLALGEAGAQTVAALLGMESALSSLLPAFDSITDAAGSLDAAFDASLATVRTLAQESQRLLGVRNAGGSLIDRIDGALGRTPGHGLLREAELWAAMTTASYDQQISLSGELFDSITSRYQTELDWVGRIRDISRSLRDYIASLSTSDLAPTSLATKVSEAERQLNEAVAKARAGDENALAQVQGLTQTALELWRRYGASGDAYQDAYYRITGSVGDLADQAMTDAERQLSVSSESLAQLEQLRGIAQTATSAIDRQYQQSIAALAQETALLTSLGQDTGRLHDIASLLGSMPAEIAARLQPMFDAAAGSTVSGWYADAGYGKGDQQGVDYWSGQLGSKPTGVVQNDFLNSLVTDWYTSALGWMPDAAGLAYWVDEAERLGASKAYEDFLRAAGINSHRDGLWSVPYDEYPATLHAGELVAPRPMADMIRGGQFGGGSAEVVAELREVRRELAETRAENARLAQMLANATIQASRNSSQEIVDGFQQRGRDDEQRGRSARAGILTT